MGRSLKKGPFVDSKLFLKVERQNEDGTKQPIKTWARACPVEALPMPVQAHHRYARITPRKVRPLADLIRGKFADEALDILRYQPQRGARMLEKVIIRRPGKARAPGQNPG